MNDFSRENPKTDFALKAVKEAVAEEAKGKDAFVSLALSVISILTMDLAMAKNGNKSKYIEADDIVSTIAMIEAVKEAIIHTFKTMDEEDEKNALN